jgi:uncharacterized membrane protein YdbT with pleckstrin-like domain
MGYVASVLQPDEKVVYETHLSWAMFIPGLIVMAATVLGYATFKLLGVPWAEVLAGIAVAAAAYMLAREWFVRWTTEIAITNKRIILKRGFIRRDTVEMSIDRVESVDVKQSLLGRALGYGDVIVRGTGSGLAPIRKIDNPLHFRSQMTAP